MMISLPGGVVHGVPLLCLWFTVYQQRVSGSRCTSIIRVVHGVPVVVLVVHRVPGLSLWFTVYQGKSKWFTVNHLGMTWGYV